MRNVAVDEELANFTIENPDDYTSDDSSDEASDDALESLVMSAFADDNDSYTDDYED